MTHEEVGRLLRVIKGAYPNFKPENIEETHDTWHWALSEYDYHAISAALKTYITTDTSGFAPSISQLIERIYTIKTAGTRLDDMEAWALVQRAISNGNYGAEEEFTKLPELVQRAVGDASLIRQWAQTDPGNVNTVIQSNFLRSYKQVCAREKDLAMMPESIRGLIAETANKIMIEGGQYE